MRRIFGSESGLDRLRMGVCLTTTSNNARINESRCFYRGGVFSGGGKSHPRHFFSYSSAGDGTEHRGLAARQPEVIFTSCAAPLVAQTPLPRVNPLAKRAKNPLTAPRA